MKGILKNISQYFTIKLTLKKCNTFKDKFIVLKGDVTGSLSL